MKYEKKVTINLGNYESVQIGVSECESFNDCDLRLSIELKRIGLVSKAVKL